MVKTSYIGCVQTVKNNELTRKQKIDYLLQRQLYADFKKVENLALPEQERERSKLEIEKAQKAFSSFEEEKINTLYQMELELEEVKKPFRTAFPLDAALNSMINNANLNYWAKMDYWKSDEAALISFGRDLTQSKANEYYTYSYNQKEEPSSLLDAVAKLKKIIKTNPFLGSGGHPSKYIKFFRDKEIAFPQKLGEYVEKYHPDTFEKRLNPAIPKPNYTTPYIELMFQAIEEHRITETNQSKKEFLTEWFLSKSTPQTQISKNKAELMATFIRLPESGIGGNKANKK